MKQKLMELGRSMVEMLGVLAIIGVLSIIGIQGYKKAMNKHKANELMNMAMQVYNANMARLVMDPSLEDGSGGYLCSNALPSTVTKDATYIAQCAGNNLGMERPSWAKNSFVIVNKLLSSTTHSLYIGGVGSCDICSELKSLTEAGSSTYRIVPGSKKAPLSNGIRIFCLYGSDTETGTAGGSSSTARQCTF